MPFKLGDDCFYTYALESMAETFGEAGAAKVTSVSDDGSLYTVVVFPKGASYVLPHTGVMEGTDPGQISSTPPPPPPPPAAADDPGGGGNRPPLRPPQK
jgi:hypothetical protein